jgi:transposase InsO family protein
VPEAARKDGFTQSEFREWTEEYHRAGVAARKLNKRGLEAEYRAEVKRLQAKIGELVMDVNAVIDCADRQCIGLNVSQRNDAREAAWALEDALMRRFGALPKGDADVTLRTDNALVYASELYRELAASYGLHQEFILPHTPEQNGVAESFIGTLKFECVWQHRFETYEEAKATITAWVKHYNEIRPHSRLGYHAARRLAETPGRNNCLKCSETAGSLHSR